jgi:hypothetical protein
VIKKKPKEPEQPPEEPEAEITITKKPEPVEEETTTTEEVKVTRKKKKKDKPQEEPAVEMTIKKPAEPEEEEEPVVEEEFTIKKKVPPKKEEDETEAEFTVKKEVEQPTEDVVEEFTIKKKGPPPRVPSIEEHEEQSITIKKLKKIRKPSRPDIPEYTEVENVTFRPKVTKTLEDVEQEFKISLDSYAEEEISMSGKVKLKKTKPMTYSEESVGESFKITREIEDDGPAIEEIIDEGSDAEELPYDDDESESYNVPLKRRPSRKYSVFEEGEEEVQLGLKKEKPIEYDEESVTVKRVKPKRKPSFDQGCISYIISHGSIRISAFIICLHHSFLFIFFFIFYAYHVT